MFGEENQILSAVLRALTGDEGNDGDRLGF